MSKNPQEASQAQKDAALAAVLRLVGRQEGVKPAPSVQSPAPRPPAGREGSMQAYNLPSRVNRRLHWPDGRVTDLS